MVEERKYQHLQVQMLVMNLHRLWCLGSAQCPEAPSVSYWGFFLMHRGHTLQEGTPLKVLPWHSPYKIVILCCSNTKTKGEVLWCFSGQFLEWARISYELFSVLSGAFGESTKYWVGPTDPAEARFGSSPSCGLQRFHVIRNPALWRLQRFQVIVSNCFSQ